MTVLTAKDALKKYFGYDSFRPMQDEIIQTVYDKNDCLFSPTGIPLKIHFFFSPE